MSDDELFYTISLAHHVVTRDEASELDTQLALALVELARRAEERDATLFRHRN
jgi:hypothetical protein